MGRGYSPVLPFARTSPTERGVGGGGLSPGQTLGHWCQSTLGHPRHARHSDTRHSDTLRHDPRVSSVQPPSDTDQTQARHLRHRRHQCQSTPLRHCFDTPRHYLSDTSDTSDTQTHQGSSVWPMACVSAAHCGAVALVLYSDPRPTDPSAASGLGSSERSRASRPVSAGLGRSRPVSSGLGRSRAVSAG